MRRPRSSTQGRALVASLSAMLAAGAAGADEPEGPASPARLEPQAPAPAAPAPPDTYANLRWWHTLAAGAGVAALLVLDRPVRDFTQDHRSSALDDVADVATTFHRSRVTLAAAGGTLAVGLALENRKVAMTGVQIAASYGLSTGLMLSTKWAFGRSRPSATPEDNTRFDWFEGGSNSAFPSGAAAVSFSLATVVADAIDRPAATVLLYTAAAANSWARVYSDRHWLTDVALGALYGITSAKLVNGRWRLFGWRLPTVAPEEGGVSLSYRLTW